MTDAWFWSCVFATSIHTIRIMKTIAITIDESTLELLDELAAAARGRRRRSALIRSAVREFAVRERQRLLEERERAILKTHRKRLGRQVRLLIAEQARP